MNIKKLEDYEEFENGYTEKVDYFLKLIEGKVDTVTAQNITNLASTCYKEGYLDGMRFCDWMHEQVR